LQRMPSKSAAPPVMAAQAALAGIALSGEDDIDARDVEAGQRTALRIG
jgi:hypothetical protein